MNKLAKNILLTTLSSLLTLIAIEVFIRAFFPQVTLSNLKSNRPNCYRTSDYLPFTLKPNCVTYHHSPEFSVTIHINNLGFRGQDFTLAKEPHTYRILVLGDSMTFGHGVADNQTFSAVLERTLPPPSGYQTVEVINAGFAAGFSPDSYYLFLKNRLAILRPNLVIFTIFALNDITDMGYHTKWLELDQSGLPTKISDKQRHVSMDGFLLDTTQPWYYRYPLISESHSLILLGKTTSTLISKINARFSPPAPQAKTATAYYQCLFSNHCFPEMDQLFNQALTVTTSSYEDARQFGAEFTAVLLPADVQIDDKAWEKYQAGEFGLSDPPYPQTRLTTFFDQYQLPYLDLLPTFIQHRQERLFFKQDGHFNPAAHNLAATTIADYISKKGYK